MTLDPEPAVTLPWLVRLRWLFLAGQLILVPLARWTLDVPRLFAAAWVLFAVSNVFLGTAMRHTRRPLGPLIGIVLVLDVVLLTVQFAALGGAMNPFTVFYLVYITLSAVVLSARWTTVIAALAMTGFGLLFLVPSEAHIHYSGPPVFDPHLQGMWVAFVLAAILTAFFIRRITQAIASQREQIATLRETAARNARLASLATLAAGAAHELNSPLGTIAVAAHEAQLRTGDLPGSGRVAADLQLILAEVDRCQDILHQMAARATQDDVVETTSLDALLDQVSAQLGDERSARLEIRRASGRSHVRAPAQPLVQSIVALVKNAFDASGPEDRVVLSIGGSAREAAIVVEDHGTGIADDVLGKVGEPFFTTKQPGHGLGLGVFLARLFFESRGGVLQIESTLGRGTRAAARLPTGEAA